MRSVAKHLPHYMALFGILLAGFAGLILFSYDQKFQIAVAAATAVSYVFWGIVHHLLHKDLYFETVIEYLTIAILGFVLIFAIITAK